MTPLDKWIWENAEIIQPKRKDPIGRIMLFAVIVCAVHAIVWSI